MHTAFLFSFESFNSNKSSSDCLECLWVRLNWGFFCSQRTNSWFTPIHWLERTNMKTDRARTGMMTDPQCVLVCTYPNMQKKPIVFVLGAESVLCASGGPQRATKWQLLWGSKYALHVLHSSFACSLFVCFIYCWKINLNLLKTRWT